MTVEHAVSLATDHLSVDALVHVLGSITHA
jgi:hypothetical protein